MAPFVGYMHICWYRPFGKLFKIWRNYNVYDVVTGIQHFFCKFLGDKNGRFRIPEIECSGM